MILSPHALTKLWTFLLTKPGKSTRPLHLPTKAPPCFDSQKQWNLYRPAAVYSAGNGFNFCSDCTKERKEDMINQGRCRWPGTTFSRPNGVIVGRRKK